MNPINTILSSILFLFSLAVWFTRTKKTDSDEKTLNAIKEDMGRRTYVVVKYVGKVISAVQAILFLWYIITGAAESIAPLLLSDCIYIAVASVQIFYILRHMRSM